MLVVAILLLILVVDVMAEVFKTYMCEQERQYNERQRQRFNKRH